MRVGSYHGTLRAFLTFGDQPFREHQLEENFPTRQGFLVEVSVYHMRFYLLCKPWIVCRREVLCDLRLLAEFLHGLVLEWRTKCGDPISIYDIGADEICYRRPCHGFERHGLLPLGERVGCRQYERVISRGQGL